MHSGGEEPPCGGRMLRASSYRHPGRATTMSEKVRLCQEVGMRGHAQTLRTKAGQGCRVCPQASPDRLAGPAGGQNGPGNPLPRRQERGQGASQTSTARRQGGAPEQEHVPRLLRTCLQTQAGAWPRGACARQSFMGHSTSGLLPGPVLSPLEVFSVPLVLTHTQVPSVYVRDLCWSPAGLLLLGKAT